MRTFGEAGGCAAADSWPVDVRAAFETVLLAGDAYLLVDGAAARGIDRCSPTPETTLSGALTLLWLALLPSIDPEVSCTRRS